MSKTTATLLFLGLTLALTGCFKDPTVPETDGFTTPTRSLSTLKSAETAPPPVTGGTLLVASDGVTALASDPDSDVVWITDLESGTLTGSVAFREGDHPWRLVEDDAGGVFVSLRNGGAVARIDLETGTLDFRQEVCAAPRGLAFDDSRQELHVACLEGSLVTLGSDGRHLRELPLKRDVRDVVITDNNVFVSVFRSADVMVLDRTANTLEREISLPSFSENAPAVAWRMRATPGGTNSVDVIHQRQVSGDLSNRFPTVEYYGGNRCDAIVRSTLSTISAAGDVRTNPALEGSVLPVDFIAQGDQIAVAGAGNLGSLAPVSTQFSPRPASRPAQLYSSVRLEMDTGSLPTSSFGGLTSDPIGCEPPMGGIAHDDAQGVAVDFDGNGRLVMQTRAPWTITVADGPTIELPVLDNQDTGHDLFHEDSGGGLACASCHAEGQDDGFTWHLEVGVRRTQDLRGGLSGTEPFHWGGDVSDFGHLMEEVFEGRMTGPQLPGVYNQAMLRWIDRTPVVKTEPMVDAAAVQRGSALFHNEEVACATCHSGDRFTNNETMDVGTSEPLQVPSLTGIVNRGPFMHNGCAETLQERFDPTCGGGDAHGKTSHLSPTEIDDLVMYLKSL